MKGWLIFGVVALVVVGGGLAAIGAGVLPLEREPAAAVEVSPETASGAEVKLERLRSGEEARLNGVELTSLFRYRPEVWALGAVIEPSVRMSLDTLQVSGSVATDRLPPDSQLDQIRYLLPDTTDVTVAGTLASDSPGSTVLNVTAIEVAGMPIPSRFYPMILDRLGRHDDLPPNAVELPLPAIVRNATIQNGELVLTP